MQKVVIDTNVFVSSLIQRSFPYLIVNSLILDGKVDLCISEDILVEYYDVLQRKKFFRYPDFVVSAESLLADISRNAKRFTPTVVLSVINDIDDNKFLELAATCKVDFIITGNTNDFTMARFRQTMIVTPREYWEHHRPIF